MKSCTLHIHERGKGQYHDPLTVNVDTTWRPKRGLSGLPVFRTLVILCKHRILYEHECSDPLVLKLSALSLESRKQNAARFLISWLELSFSRLSEKYAAILPSAS